MPLNYLSGNPQDVWAMRELGDTFSNAVIGLHRQRLQQQQLAQQAALEQAYLQMAREKQAQEGPLRQAQTQSYQAGADLDKAKAAQMTQSTGAGDRLGFDIQQYYNAQSLHDPEVLNMIAAQIAQQQGVLAATHPANVGVQVPQIMESVDPMVRQAIATRTPLMQRMSPGATLFDVRQDRPVYTAPGQAHTAAPTFDERLELDRKRAMHQALLKSAVTPTRAQGVYQQLQGEGSDGPKVGEVRKGYRFKGGDPSKRGSWEAVQ